MRFFLRRPKESFCSQQRTIKSWKVWVIAEITQTWHLHRRSSHQDPTWVPRTSSSRAEQPELGSRSSSRKGLYQKSETKRFYSRALNSLVASTSSSFWMRHNEKQYLCFVHPPPCPPSLCPVSRLVAPVHPEGSELRVSSLISWGSQSHFLLFSQTQSFLKMDTHTLTWKKSRRTHRRCKYTTSGVQTFPVFVAESHMGNEDIFHHSIQTEKGKNKKEHDCISKREFKKRFLKYFPFFP